MSKPNLALKQFFDKEQVQQKFRELLGSKAPGFITSVLQVVQSNDTLKDAEPATVLNAAATAAILDLPINNNLGFAYIVPYRGQAQFQMGYKGFIQLAQRSGQFLTISATAIYNGQIKEANPLTGYTFDFTVKAEGSPIGYAAYFKLINGFEKTIYMTVDELKKHGTNYSQTFKKGFGLWKDNFDAMAQKTVLKLLLSKFAPLSIEMTRAIIADQAVVNDVETQDVSYVDNGEETPISLEDLRDLYEAKKEALSLEEQKSAERIINTPEPNSFRKLFNELSGK